MSGTKLYQRECIKIYDVEKIGEFIEPDLTNDTMHLIQFQFVVQFQEIGNQMSLSQ